MKKTILILGASGAVAQHFISQFEKQPLSDWTLKLLVRSPKKLPKHQRSSYAVIVGDASDSRTVMSALTEDVKTIYSNLGDRHVDHFAKTLLAAIKLTHNKPKIVWLAGAGIENEGTGQVARVAQMDQAILTEQQSAANLIEHAGLIYTILRPVLLTNNVVGPVKIYPSGVNIPEQFISRASVAKVALQAATTAEYDNQSIGLVNEE